MSQDLIQLIALNELSEKTPVHALAENTDLVLIRYGDNVSVLYGRCQHRGALMSDGVIVGDDLICGLHNWDYRYDTGVSAYNNGLLVKRF